MEMSVREARAQFAAALAAAESGERVTITRNGKPVAVIGPPAERPNTFSWEKLEAWRRERGFDKIVPLRDLDEEWREEFDDPTEINKLFGIGNDGEDADLR